LQIICSNPERYNFIPTLGSIRPTDNVIIRIEIRLDKISKHSVKDDTIKILSSSINPGLYDKTTLENYWRVC